MLKNEEGPHRRGNPSPLGPPPLSPADVASGSCAAGAVALSSCSNSSSSSNRSPIAADLQQQDEWGAAAAALPQAADPLSPVLFSFLGEEYRKHEWVRLKSQSSKDWIAQIIAYVPPSETAAKDAAAKDAAAAAGKIVCRWAWDPADLREECCPDLPLEVYSHYELVPALNFADLNPVASIKGKIRVETLNQWLCRTSFPNTSSSSSSSSSSSGSTVKEVKEETGSEDEGLVSPVLFYRHAFDVDCGFDPQIPADSFRFKRIKIQQQQQQQQQQQEEEQQETAAAPAPSSAFRKRSAARNPDCRLFFCFKCKHTFGPPDDARPPPWKPGPHQGPLLRQYLQKKLNSSSSINRGVRDIYELLQRELEAEGPQGVPQQTPQGAPIYIESPDCLLFLYKRFPAQGDVTICCWRCGRREQRRDAARDAAAAAAASAAAAGAAAGTGKKKQREGVSPKASSAATAAAAAASRKRISRVTAGDQQQDVAAAAAKAHRAQRVREERRRRRQQQQGDTDMEPTGSEYTYSGSHHSSNSSSSSNAGDTSDPEFDVAELREEYLSLHELDKEEIKIKEKEAVKQRAAAAAAGTSSSSSSNNNKCAPQEETPRVPVTAAAGAARRHSNAVPRAAAGHPFRKQQQQRGTTLLGPLVRQRDWQQGAARRLQKLEEIYHLGISELQPTLQLQQEADAAAEVALAAAAAAAATDSSSNSSLLPPQAPPTAAAAAAAAAGGVPQQQQQQQQTEVTLLPAELKYPSAATFAAAVDEAFSHTYGGAPPRLRQQRLYELLANLKRENNRELRQKVLLGTMSLSSLLAADADALAPAEIRRERREERERHFRRAVLLTETIDPQQLLKKTHKGLETVRDDQLLLLQQQQQQQKNRRPAVRHSSSSSSNSSSSSSTSSNGDSGSSPSGSGSGSSSSSSSEEETEGERAATNRSGRDSGAAAAAADGENGDAAAAPAAEQVDVKKELHALQQLFGNEAPVADDNDQQQQQQQGDEAVGSKEKPRVRFAVETKESRGGSRRSSSSRKQQQQQQQQHFELLHYMVPQGFSNRPLSVPPSVAAYTPEASKQRVLQLLQRVQQQQHRRLIKQHQQQQQEDPGAAAAAHAIAADCSSMRSSFADLLQCAFVRVTTELTRSKGEAR